MLYQIMKNTIILLAVSLFFSGTIAAQKTSRSSMYGGITTGLSSIDTRSAGFGIEIGLRVSLKKRWETMFALNSHFAESTGGFENPENLPYLVNNAFASNPLLNFHDPDTEPDAFPGIIQFHTTFNRHSIWSANLMGGYELLNKPKQSLSAQLGVSFQYIDLVHTDYFLRGSYSAFISGTFDAIFPVYRHQRFFDIGPSLQLHYAYQFSENWYLGGRIGGSYMPKSSTSLVGLTAYVGVAL
jgi:hypothetical protein